MTARAPADRGAATLFAVACVAVLLLLGSALGVVAALVRAHRSAQSAADLAALAAASAVGAGRGDPCGAGSETAAANGARLLSCVVSGREATVRVSVTGPRWLGLAADLEGEARAGSAAGPPG